MKLDTVSLPYIIYDFFLLIRRVFLSQGKLVISWYVNTRQNTKYFR